MMVVRWLGNHMESCQRSVNLHTRILRHPTAFGGAIMSPTVPSNNYLATPLQQFDEAPSSSSPFAQLARGATFDYTEPVSEWDRLPQRFDYGESSAAQAGIVHDTYWRSGDRFATDGCEGSSSGINNFQIHGLNGEFYNNPVRIL